MPTQLPVSLLYFISSSLLPACCRNHIKKPSQRLFVDSTFSNYRHHLLHVTVRQITFKQFFIKTFSGPAVVKTMKHFVPKRRAVSDFLPFSSTSLLPPALLPTPPTSSERKFYLHIFGLLTCPEHPLLTYSSSLLLL